MKTKGLAQKRSLKKGKMTKDTSLKNFRRINSNLAKRDDNDDDDDNGDDDDDDDDIDFLWPGLHGFSTNRGWYFLLSSCPFCITAKPSKNGIDITKPVYVESNKV